MINFLIEQDKKGQLVLERTYVKQKIKHIRIKPIHFPFHPESKKV